MVQTFLWLQTREIPYKEWLAAFQPKQKPIQGLRLKGTSPQGRQNKFGLYHLGAGRVTPLPLKTT